MGPYGPMLLVLLVLVDGSQMQSGLVSADAAQAWSAHADGAGVRTGALQPPAHCIVADPVVALQRPPMLLLQAHVPDACAQAACHLISAIDHTQSTVPASDATAGQYQLGGPAVTAAVSAVTTAATNATAEATNHAAAPAPAPAFKTATTAGGLTDGEQSHDPFGGSLIPLPVGTSSVDLSEELAALLMAQQQHTQAMPHPNATKRGRGASHSRSNSSQRTMKLTMQCDNGDTLHSANSTGACINTTCSAPALQIVTATAAAECPAGSQQLHGWEVVEVSAATAAAETADMEHSGRNHGSGWSVNMHSRNGSTSAGVYNLVAEQPQPAEHYESTWLFMLDLVVAARDSGATAGGAASSNEDQMVAEASEHPAAAAAGVQSGAGAHNESWAAGCSDSSAGSFMRLWLARLLLAAWLALLQSAARTRTGLMSVFSLLDSYRQKD